MKYFLISIFKIIIIVVIPILLLLGNLFTLLWAFKFNEEVNKDCREMWEKIKKEKFYKL